MVPGLFNDPTNRALKTALSGLQLRQQTIANNIANAETPNYKAQAVQFEDALAAEMAGPPPRQPELQRLGLVTTDVRHIPLAPRVAAFTARPAVVTSLNGTLRNDGNTVDVEREMTKLAETQLTYSALGQVTSSKMGVLRAAINEGRR